MPNTFKGFAARVIGVSGSVVDVEVNQRQYRLDWTADVYRYEPTLLGTVDPQTGLLSEPRVGDRNYVFLSGAYCAAPVQVPGYTPPPALTGGRLFSDQEHRLFYVTVTNVDATNHVVSLYLDGYEGRVTVNWRDHHSVYTWWPSDFGNPAVLPAVDSSGWLAVTNQVYAGQYGINPTGNQKWPAHLGGPPNQKYYDIQGIKVVAVRTVVLDIPGAQRFAEVRIHDFTQVSKCPLRTTLQPVKGSVGSAGLTLAVLNRAGLTPPTGSPVPDKDVLGCQPPPPPEEAGSAAAEVTDAVGETV